LTEEYVLRIDKKVFAKLRGRLKKAL